MSFKDAHSAEKNLKSSLSDLQELFTGGCMATFTDIYTVAAEQGYEAGDSASKIQKKFNKTVEKLWNSNELQAFVDKYFDEKKITPPLEIFLKANTYLTLSERYGSAVPQFSFEIPDHIDVVSKIIDKAAKAIKKNSSAFDPDSDDYEAKQDDVEEKISDTIQSSLEGLVSKKDIMVVVPRPTVPKKAISKKATPVIEDDYSQDDEVPVEVEKRDEIGELMEKIQKMTKDNPKRSAYKKKLKALLLAAEESD